MSLVLDEHRQYLADTVRVGAFDRAIAEVVRPRDCVLDLASGTGILGLLACRHGARRVYAIDNGSITGLAREFARANGYADRIVAIREVSTRTGLPEPVDLIVTDQIGRLGFEAGLIEYVADARDRFLRPGGRIIPMAVQVCVAAFETPQARADLEFWRSKPSGFDLSAAYPTALNTGYPIAASREQLLSSVVPVLSIDMATVQPGAVSGEIELVVNRDGTCDGLLGGFVATLAPGVTMTNLVSEAVRINRRNAFLPIGERVAVRRGDRIAASVRVLPVEALVRWSVTLPDGRRLDQSTARGLLLSSEDLEKSRPTFVPELTAWGRARRTVLELCDGRMALERIEQELAARHPDLFRTRADAQAFVAEVVAPYAVSARGRTRSA